MEAKYLDYKYENRLEKIDKILDNPNIIVKRNSKKFPSEKELRHGNGFDVQVAILAVDIRGSTKLSKILSNKHDEILTKLYKVYIEELIAVMKGCPNIVRIYIEGDGVWGVFSIEEEKDIVKVFSTSARISSLIDILNVKLIEKRFPDIKIGMGMNVGKSLYVLAGYKYTNINEDVWLGNVVNKAFKLGDIANKGNIKELVVSKEVYKYLEKNQKSKLEYNEEQKCYHGKVPNEQMQDWLVKNSPTYIRCEGDYCHYLIENKWWKSKFWFVILIGLSIWMWQQGLLFFKV